MLNYPNIVNPRKEIFEDINFSSKSLNELKTEIIKSISSGLKTNDGINFNEKYSNLISDINQNAVIKNIFLKKNNNQQIDLINEILKELNEIKFSKKSILWRKN